MTTRRPVSERPASPSRIKDRCHELRSLARGVSEDYRWAYFAAWDRSVVGDEARVRAARSDPTGSLATDEVKQAMRRNLAHAAELIERSIVSLEAAHRLIAGDPSGRRLIRGSLDSLDPRSLDTHSTGRITRAEHAASLEALARRGPGYGET